jgi:hypothetical protein
MFSETINYSDIAYKIGIPKSYIEIICPQKKDVTELEKQEIYHPFRLPITYIDKDEKTVFPLLKSVVDDLELDTTIYNHILKPTNEFGKLMKKEWCKNITTNIEFLKETQIVLEDIDDFKERNVIDTDKFMSIWQDTKNNENFLEKYYYMDWDALLHLNKSSQFLQLLTVANVLSPVISLLIPIIFLIFPFLILKLQGIPITFDVYINVLKETARNHFIGKTIMNIESLSFEKMIYVIFTFGLYIVQIYQNLNVCNRFYSNVKVINTNLLYMKTYLSNTTKQMDLFFIKHHEKKTYMKFCEDIRVHSEILKKFHKELLPITEFRNSLW